MSSSQHAASDEEYLQQLALLRSMESTMTYWTGTKERFDVDFEKLSLEVKHQLRNRWTLGSGKNGDVHQVVCQKIPMARKSVRSCEGRSLQDIKSEIAAIQKLTTHRHIIEIMGSYTTSHHGDDTLHILTFPVAHCDLDVFLNFVQSLGREDNWSEMMLSLNGRRVGAAAGIGAGILTGEAFNLESLGIVLRKCMGCMAETVAWIHSKKISHDDLKPANILVRNGCIYITDFGISRDRCDATHTSTELFPGATYGYTAPEKEQKESHNPFQADIYSLGCIYMHIISVISRKKSREECQETLRSKREQRQQLIQDFLRPFVPSLKDVIWNRLTSSIRLGQILTPEAWPFRELVYLITSMLLNDRKGRPDINQVNEKLLQIGGADGTFHGRCCRPGEASASEEAAEWDMIALKEESTSSKRKLEDAAESEKDSPAVTGIESSAGTGIQSGSENLPPALTSNEEPPVGTDNQSRTFGSGGSGGGNLGRLRGRREWSCCYCGDSGMVHGSCPSCGHSRCGFCAVYRSCS